MNILHVKPILSQKQIDKLYGNFLDETYLKHPVIRDNTIVYNEQGDKVLVFLKNVISKENAKLAYKVLRNAATDSNNRAIAAGPINAKIGEKVDYLTVGELMTGNRFRPLKKDGTLSNSPKAKSVKSGIIGYSDRYSRIPYCRTTEFTKKNFEEYKKALPYIVEISELFKKHVPDKYENQRKVWEKTNTDFKIGNTVFTTITVNKNFRTACHYDKGDLKEGFGNLGVLEAGEYSGAYTILPKYGIGIDVRSCDLSFFDVHELHGNTELKRIGNSERISIVCYYRKKMIQCGSAKEELERIKNK